MFGMLKKKTQVVAFLFNFFGSELLVYVPFQHINHTLTSLPQESVFAWQLSIGFFHQSLRLFFFSTFYANYILENGNLNFQDFVYRSETRFQVGLSG